MMSSTQDGGFQALLGAQYVLFEDCFAYGDSRAVFRIGSTGTPSQYVIFRRTVARHDYTTNTNPTAAYMHYGGDNVLCQNCIVIDQETNDANFASAYARYGGWESKNGTNVFIKDSIAVNNIDEFHFGDTSTDNVRISNSVFWGVGTGSTSRSGNTLYDNLTIGDVNAQNTENTFDDRSSTATVYFTDSIFHDIEGTGIESGFRSKTILNQVNESTNNLFNPIQNDLTIGDTTDIITGIDPTDGTPGNGIPGILYPVRIENGSDAKSYGVGATIMYKRGESGTLWGETGYDDVLSEPLWPWVYEDEIKAKMAVADVSSGSISVTGARGFAVPNETLTNYIWGYIGNTVPPFNVLAKAGEKSVALQWDPPAAAAVSTITGFNIYDVTGLVDPVVPGSLSPIATVSGNATFTKTVTGLTGNANYEFAVTAVDSSKGESSYSYIVSATPSAASFTPSSAVITTPVSGYVINMDNRSSFTIAGTADANTSVEAFIGTTSLGTVTSDGSGNWSMNADLSSLGLSEGAVSISTVSNALTSAAINGAYDISTGATISAPSASFTISSGNQSNFAIIGTALSQIGVEVFLEGVSLGSTTSDSSGNWSINADVSSSGVSEGAVSLTAVSNGVASAAVNGTYDTSMPSVIPAVIVTPAENFVINMDSQSSFSVAGTAEANTGVEVFLNGMSLGNFTADGSGNWSFTANLTSLGLSDGVVSLAAVSNGVSSTAVNGTYDSTPPAVTTSVIVTPSTGFYINLTNRNNFAITGAAAANTSVEVFVENVSIGTTTSDNNGDWSLSADLSSLSVSEGAVALTAVSDSVTSSAINGTYDITPPVTPAGLTGN